MGKRIEFTPEQDEKLKELAKENASLFKMGKILNIYPGICKRRIAELKIPYSIRKVNKRTLSKEEEQIFLTMANEGAYINEIMEALKMSYPTVINLFEQYGIERKATKIPEELYDEWEHVTNRLKLKHKKKKHKTGTRIIPKPPHGYIY